MSQICTVDELSQDLHKERKQLSQHQYQSSIHRIKRRVASVIRQNDGLFGVFIFVFIVTTVTRSYFPQNEIVLLKCSTFKHP